MASNPPPYMQPGFKYANSATAPWYTSGAGGISGYDASKSLNNMKTGYSGGAGLYDLLAGLKDSPLGALLGGAGGSNLAKLQGDPAYQKLLAMANGHQSFGDWYNQSGANNDFAKPLALLEQMATAANPSGMAVISPELLAAQGLAGVETGARGLRQDLMAAGRAGGNRSGIGDLASLLPGQMVAGQGGAIRTQASLGSADMANQRGLANANLRLGATTALGGLSAQKAGMSSGALMGYSQLQQNAQQAAMAALLEVLGLDAALLPKISGSYSPMGGFQLGFSSPLGLAA
ncbi:MAG: hypothetical protein FJ296_00710 [Planctomycetes bacterium]|nr:hypothetical protein [Planctomycetota bacterium]